MKYPFPIFRKCSSKTETIKRKSYIYDGNISEKGLLLAQDHLSILKHDFGLQPGALLPHPRLPALGHNVQHVHVSHIIHVHVLHVVNQGRRSNFCLLLNLPDLKFADEVRSIMCKGNRTIADLRYGLEDSISPSTLIFTAIKS